LSAVHLYHIIATHKNGKRIRPLLWHNEQNECAALRALDKIKAEWPSYRFKMTIIDRFLVERNYLARTKEKC